jgi:hypothetical protein
MPLLQEFSSQAGSFDIAIVAATISILIGGILFGVGLGFGLRRVRLAGAEEIGQGIISAAMVGALFSFTLLLDSAVPSLVPQGALPDCPGIEAPSSSPFSYYACNLQALSDSLRSLGSSLFRSADIAGLAGSLQVSASEISMQPFFALQAASQQLSSSAQEAQSLSALSYFELELALAVRASALAVFLPAGLVLRTFFATRRLGAAAMAIAIAAYMIYPLLFLHTFPISKANSALGQALGAAAGFNSAFATIPLLDLEQPGAVRAKISEMASGDFPGKVQLLFPLSLRATSLAKADLLLYPLLSLLISAVAALELYRLLSAPLLLSYFESI